MHLQKEIVEGVERRRNCDEQCEQSPEERGQAPTIESVWCQPAQFKPAYKVENSGQYQRKGWCEENRPGTKDRVGNIGHGLNNNSAKCRITLACIAHKSLEICQRCRLRAGRAPSRALGSRGSDFAERGSKCTTSAKLCRTGCDPSRIPLLFGENSLKQSILIHLFLKTDF